MRIGSSTMAREFNQIKNSNLPDKEKDKLMLEQMNKVLGLMSAYNYLTGFNQNPNSSNISFDEFQELMLNKDIKPANSDLSKPIPSNVQRFLDMEMADLKANTKSSSVPDSSVECAELRQSYIKKAYNLGIVSDKNLLFLSEEVKNSYFKAYDFSSKKSESLKERFSFLQ
jgi:hypothetical protein